MGKIQLIGIEKRVVVRPEPAQPLGGPPRTRPGQRLGGHVAIGPRHVGPAPVAEMDGRPWRAVAGELAAARASQASESELTEMGFPSGR